MIEKTKFFAFKSPFACSIPSIFVLYSSSKFSQFFLRCMQYNFKILDCIISVSEYYYFQTKQEISLASIALVVRRTYSNIKRKLRYTKKKLFRKMETNYKYERKKVDQQ